MVELEFNFNQAITIIQANLEDQFQMVINKYIQKTDLEPNSLCFLANGIQINPAKSIESHMSDLNKKNQKMTVLVNELNVDVQDKGQTFAKSKDVICPECKKPCRISFENYKIKLSGCVNGHEISDIKILDFPNTQKVELSQIICDKCKIKNKGNCPSNEFFRCLACNQNLCLICRSNHNLSHNIIEYDQKDYICQKHFDSFIKYCKQCKKDICFGCQEHNEHQSVYLGELLPNMEEKKKILDDMKAIIDSINKEIKGVIEQLNGFCKIINTYYDINNDIYNNYSVKRRNYQIIENLKEINDNNKIFQKLKNINNNIKDKLLDILDFYNNMNKDDIKIIKNQENSSDIKNQMNQMTIIYKINNKDNKLKL